MHHVPRDRAAVKTQNIKQQNIAIAGVSFWERGGRLQGKTSSHVYSDGYRLLNFTEHCVET